MAGFARFIGRFFDPVDFAAYAAGMARTTTAWKPSGITVHHTASPSLAQRPHGFTSQHMLNIRSGYETERGWSSGPHFFIDQNGIWVFVDPRFPGIHAASFNSTCHGMEMLGDYDSEPINDAVLRNTAVCIRECMKAWGYTEYNFHRNDPKTNKTCPGTRITRDLIDHALLVSEPIKPVTIEFGDAKWQETAMINNRIYVPVRRFSAWLGIPKSWLYWGEEGLHIDGNAINGETMIADACWAPAAEIAKCADFDAEWNPARKTLTLKRGLQ